MPNSPTHPPANPAGEVASAADIARCLRARPVDPEIGYVVQMPGRTRVEPKEIWIPELGAWVRCDGSSASFDGARGYRYFGNGERDRIKRAARAFAAHLLTQATTPTCNESLQVAEQEE